METNLNQFEQKYEKDSQSQSRLSQILTKFPKSRYDCYNLFKQPIEPQEKKLNLPVCYDQIRQNLEKMKKYGYQYEIATIQQFDHKLKKNYMKRKVKFGFRCFDCKKDFNSIVGTFQIKFQILGLQNQTKFVQKNSKNLKIIFKCRTYKMKCEKCMSWCKGKIFQSQLNAVANSFCLIVAQMIENIPPPEHKDDRFKLNEDAHHHKQQLCEACQLGKCYARPKGAQNIKENKQANIYQDQQQEFKNNEQTNSARQGTRRRY